MTELEEIFDSFACRICFNEYDEEVNYPNIICINLHFICNECYSKIRGVRNFIQCPFCKQVTERQPIKYRQLFDVKNALQRVAENNNKRSSSPSKTVTDSPNLKLLREYEQREKKLTRKLQYRTKELSRLRLADYISNQILFEKKQLMNENQNLRQDYKKLYKQHEELSEKFNFRELQIQIRIIQLKAKFFQEKSRLQSLIRKFQVGKYDQKQQRKYNRLSKESQLKQAFYAQKNLQKNTEQFNKLSQNQSINSYYFGQLFRDYNFVMQPSQNVTFKRKETTFKKLN